MTINPKPITKPIEPKTEEIPVKIEDEKIIEEIQKTQSLERITDQFLLYELMNEYTPAVTKKIPLVVQGINIETESLLLSDLYSIGNSDNGRIKALSMVYQKLTKSTKAIFDNKIENFFKAISIYDMELIYATHSESFGEEEFVFTCENENCKKEVEFKAKMRDLRNGSDVLIERLKDIEAGKEVSIFEIKNPIIKINDNISFKVGIPSLDKYKTLMERNISPAIFKTLLSLESIIFTQKNSELVYETKYLPEFIQILEKIILPKSYSTEESEIFKDLEIVFEAKIQCPHCGTINHKYKTDILGELVKKAMA